MSATATTDYAQIAIQARNLYSSPTVTTLLPAVVRAQKRLGPITANSINPDFDSRYADLASVLDEVRRVLNEDGIFISQPTSSRLDSGLLVVDVETLLIHECGEYMGSTLSLFSQHLAAHSLGSLQTYGRRYALQALTGTAAHHDDDDGKRAMEESGVPRASRTPADHVAPASTTGGDDALRRVTAQINELPDQPKAVLWAAFEEKVHRRYARATDLPLLQLLLTRALKQSEDTAEAS